MTGTTSGSTCYVEDNYFPGQLVLLMLCFLSPLPLSSLFLVAASTPNSTAGAAMNSLTSLGTLQGLAGATVGLNNINALAGTINSEYLLLWRTAFPQILHRKWSARDDLKRLYNWEN